MYNQSLHANKLWSYKQSSTQPCQQQFYLQINNFADSFKPWKPWKLQKFTDIHYTVTIDSGKYIISSIPNILNSKCMTQIHTVRSQIIVGWNFHGSAILQFSRIPLSYYLCLAFYWYSGAQVELTWVNFLL